MRLAIIGGTGQMGRWFAKFFLDQGASVIVSGRNKEKLLKIRDEFGVEIADNVNAAKGADRVLICVSIESFEDVVKEIHSYIKQDQVVMDICSIKEMPVDTMHKYLTEATTLGTHPMFGPNADSLQNQNYVLTPTNDKERQFANDFKQWLEEKKARVSIMSPKRHDELMSVVLGLAHFVGAVACDTLLSQSNFTEMKKVAGPSYKTLLKLAEGVTSQDPNFYATLQMNLPNVEEIEGLFYKKTGEWLNIVKKKDKLVLANKMKSVKKKLEGYES
jgi:prephenate dehydrogenase